MITINGYVIDVAVTEEHVFDSDVTEHPVEKGANVTDHKRRKPAVVTIEGVVSDTPMGQVALDPSRQGSTKPSEDALAFLLALDESREAVPLTTALRRYENMLLTSLNIPKSAATGEALRFRASFKQVTFAANRRTIVRTAVPRSKGKAKRGTKPSRPLTPEEARALAAKGLSPEGRDSSMAVKGLDAFTGLF